MAPTTRSTWMVGAAEALGNLALIDEARAVWSRMAACWQQALCPLQVKLGPPWKGPDHPSRAGLEITRGPAE